MASEKTPRTGHRSNIPFPLNHSPSRFILAVAKHTQMFHAAAAQNAPKKSSDEMCWNPTPVLAPTPA